MGFFESPVSGVSKKSSDDPRPIRFRTLVAIGDYWAGDKLEGCSPNFYEGVDQGFWNEENDGMFSISGIKLWADGSTQGCTAGLFKPYARQGHCGTAGWGLQNAFNREDKEELRENWEGGWPMQIHCNGDQTIKDALLTLSNLQEAHENTQPHVLIHFTVGGEGSNGEDLVVQAAALRAGDLNQPLNLTAIRLW